MTGFDVCSEVLRAKGLSPQEMLAAWKSFTMCKFFSLYLSRTSAADRPTLSSDTNGEPCPMVRSAPARQPRRCPFADRKLTSNPLHLQCASALRWSGIGEVVWGTSIESLIAGEPFLYFPLCSTREPDLFLEEHRRPLPDLPTLIYDRLGELRPRPPVPVDRLGLVKRDGPNLRPSVQRVGCMCFPSFAPREERLCRRALTLPPPLTRAAPPCRTNSPAQQIASASPSRASVYPNVKPPRVGARAGRHVEGNGRLICSSSTAERKRARKGMMSCRASLTE